jgi:hypothetical protein
MLFDDTGSLYPAASSSNLLGLVKLGPQTMVDEPKPIPHLPPYASQYR